MQQTEPQKPTQRVARRAMMAAGAMLAVAVVWKFAVVDRTPPPPPLDPAAVAALQHAAFTQAEVQPGFVHAENVQVKVLSGETLESAVERAGVAREDAQHAVEILAQSMDTVHIKAGMAVEAAIAKPLAQRGSVRLVGLSMRTGPATAITLSRSFDGALRLRALDEKVRDETVVANGVIAGSLYESAERLGATPAITAGVVRLFAHKLDFQRDLDTGDAFKLVFDRKVTESGRTVEAGDLEYAELH
ncbi:MAG: M23 family peptidase, partial [Phenylobacterium sp.]